MPLPTPRQGEPERAFISRCVSSDVVQRDFPRQRVRLGVCYSQWRRGPRAGEKETQKQ